MTGVLSLSRTLHCPGRCYMTWEGMEIKEKPGDMLQRTLSSLKSLVLVVRVHKVLSEHSPLPRPLRAY